MDNITNKEKEIIEVIKDNPTLGQEEIANRVGMTRTGVAGHLARLIKKGYIQRGYILNQRVNGIAVIGGANVDIKGISETSFKYGSSNPGIIYKSAGGVARNVAENLARLELPVSLFTAMGQDSESDWLLNITAKAGVNTQYVERVNGARAGIYLSILDDNKEQIGSIADMEVINYLTVELLQKNASIIAAAELIFLDTNLPTETISYLFEYSSAKNIPIIVDPVSAKKAIKVKEYLKNIDTITPNKEEAEVLSGVVIKTEADIEAAARALLEQGINNVVITLGADGVYVATAENHRLISSPKVKIVDTTGAGDSFVAGIIYGLYNGLDIFESCEYGHTMATFTLSKEETVVSDLSKHILELTKKELFQNGY